MSKTYKIRYSVESWGKPSIEPSRRVVRGLRITKSRFGYTDRLFLMSILNDENGNVESAVMLDSETGPRLTPKIIELVQRQLDHYEKEHLFKEGLRR